MSIEMINELIGDIKLIIPSQSTQIYGCNVYHLYSREYFVIKRDKCYKKIGIKTPFYPRKYIKNDILSETFENYLNNCIQKRMNCIVMKPFCGDFSYIGSDNIVDKNKIINVDGSVKIILNVILKMYREYIINKKVDYFPKISMVLMDKVLDITKSLFDNIQVFLKENKELGNIIENIFIVKSKVFNLLNNKVLYKKILDTINLKSNYYNCFWFIDPYGFGYVSRPKNLYDNIMIQYKHKMEHDILMTVMVGAALKNCKNKV